MMFSVGQRSRGRMEPWPHGRKNGWDLISHRILFIIQLMRFYPLMGLHSEEIRHASDYDPFCAAKSIAIAFKRWYNR